MRNSGNLRPAMLNFLGGSGGSIFEGSVSALCIHFFFWNRLSCIMFLNHMRIWCVNITLTIRLELTLFYKDVYCFGF